MFFDKRIKLFLVIILILAFSIISWYSINTTNYRTAKEVFLSKEELKEIEENLENNLDYVFELRIDSNKAYINFKENRYYFYMTEDNAGKYLDLDIDFCSKESYKFAVLNESYDKDKGMLIDFSKPIEVIIYNNQSYCKKEIQLTCLPILNITVGNSNIDRTEQPSIIELYGINHDNKNYIDILSTEALIRTRGGTSSHYPKQQYRLKLRYDGKANNLSLLGMDADEDWILDALYADYSKIRNKLSFEIWNDMYDCSEKKESTKQHARYVDVYINQEYVGLYMLKEFIDWKKLGLDKNNENGSGVLIKGMAYATVGWDGYELTKHTGMVFPFYVKYPKEQENYSKYWEAIMPKIHTNFYDKKNITEEYLLENFEIENYIDYKLLMNFICANDNFGVKNVYASIKNLNEDTKVVLTPWDLDMTYGYSWGGKTGLYENSDNLKKIDNMWIDSDYINNLIKERYKELREKVYNMDNINKKIDSYYRQIQYSAKRDSDKWLETDVKVETDKIRSWLEERIKILDKYFGEK